MTPADFILDFETVHFPAALCTIPHPHEPGIWDAPNDAWYLCVIVDKQNEDGGQLRVLRPYMARNLPRHKPPRLYGWVNEIGKFVDHVTHSIHEHPEVVVAWRKLHEKIDLRTVFGVLP